jgi:hypothetical protein
MDYDLDPDTQNFLQYLMNDFEYSLEDVDIESVTNKYEAVLVFFYYYLNRLEKYVDPLILRLDDIEDIICYCIGDMLTQASIMQLAFLYLLKDIYEVKKISVYDIGMTKFEKSIYRKIFPWITLLRHEKNIKNIKKPTLIYLPCCPLVYQAQLIDNIKQKYIYLLTTSKMYSKYDDLYSYEVKLKDGAELCARYISFKTDDPWRVEMIKKDKSGKNKYFEHIQQIIEERQ